MDDIERIKGDYGEHEKEWHEALKTIGNDEIAQKYTGDDIVADVKNLIGEKLKQATKARQKKFKEKIKEFNNTEYNSDDIKQYSEFIDVLHGACVHEAVGQDYSKIKKSPIKRATSKFDLKKLGKHGTGELPVSVLSEEIVYDWDEIVERVKKEKEEARDLINMEPI